MKAVLPGLLIVGLVLLAAFSGIASAVSLGLNYSDPASDVAKLWTSNMTPVLDAGGNATLSPFPDSVNILWIRSANASANVTLTIEVKGEIANLDNTSYEVRLYTRTDNASHFVVTYVNGTTTLSSNATGYQPVDISGNSSIAATGPNPALQNALQINVSKALLGTIPAWNLDAIAKQTGPTYTYQDTGWQVPGNPGSTPPASPTPSGSPIWIWIALAVGIVAVLAVIALFVRRKRTPPST